ncbi:hypothetical protein Dtox_3706 [Desulfofarcimen acetoxidans DSM 771]|uniref:Uncharacterized protein n=1 Tax=Desulfofarcimen acetoxidans (strain ATCC 49208 / DSM 771 / KCTC 5769 / VKM B-1644 / 5575) TaxID=485916 RepID=C8VWQ0_DESAS|nr:hypothetical protein [Desulfofarcimen acetoxidans]ACV64414.1 hypothetical protein Dtox_3706 [Desulfofarcimen acetoxidans DSM 771]
MGLKEKVKRIENRMGISSYEIQLIFEGMPPSTPIIVSKDTWYKIRHNLLISSFGQEAEKEHDRQDIAHSKLLIIKFTGENDLED